jgi:FAD/FMN-containing dehydrogenase
MMEIGEIRTAGAIFSGDLLRPGDDGYDRARQVHNGLIDKQPALIARCRNTADIVGALDLAEKFGMEISVRGGGHSIAGRGVVEDGLMIDLSPMRKVDLDPKTRTARAEGGATWGEFNEATSRHGLATTGGVVSTTGIAGLTLGGGLGWLMGTRGLSVDNLQSVEVVTAAGEVLTVNTDSHPDLFWALRGGGGNFGVAASFEFRLHPVTEVYGGLVAHPFDAAWDFLRFCGEYSMTAADELALMPLLVHAPDGSGVRLAATAVAHFGSREQADADLRPLLEFGSPAMTQVGPMAYPALNTMLDDGFPRGALYYWKSSFIPALSDDAIKAIIDQFAVCPSPMSGIAIEHLHGAVSRVPITATAFPHREESYNVLLAGVWSEPAATEENIAWTRATYQALQPLLTSRRYVNYFSDDDVDAIPNAYGPNLDRLALVKRRYDPNNRFHINHNILPSA